jgi:hypothetical protein
VEYARRSIPVELRPSFIDMEITIKRDARIPPAPKPDAPPGAIPGASKSFVPEDAHAAVQPA